jgi:hypothetical protein
MAGLIVRLYPRIDLGGSANDVCPRQRVRAAHDAEVDVYPRLSISGMVLILPTFQIPTSAFER